MLVLLCKADKNTGLGHLVRCQALAAEARSRSEQVAFLLPTPSDRVHSFVTSMGSRVVPLPDDEVATVASRAQQLGASTIVVDGYHFAPSFYSALRESLRVVAIDDLADRALDVDFVVNHNPYAADLEYRVGSGTKLLLGLDYALLRPEFRRLRERGARPRSGPVRHIVVMMGGADVGGMTPVVLEALDDFDGKVSAVIGPACNHSEDADEIAAASKAEIEVLHDVPDIAGLIASADLGVIGAGGATWEFAILGVPVLHVILEANQAKVADAAQAAGFSRSLGAAGQLSRRSVAEELSFILENDALRLRMAQLGQGMVDGKGAQRVLDAIGVSGGVLTLRPAKTGDERSIWDINNERSVRSKSVSTDPIPWPSHQEWFSNALASQATQLWMIEVAGLVCGVIRFDLADHHAVLSIALTPQARGKGLGTSAIREAALDMLRSAEQIDRVVARIRPDNIGSVVAFERAGFQFEKLQCTKGVELAEYVLQREVLDETR